MMNSLEEKKSTLDMLIEEHLKPHVKKIDVGEYYAEEFLKKLGELGFLSSVNKTQKEIITEGMSLVEEVSKVCMTTAFCLWCHLASLTYLRTTKNESLKNKYLPLLENGELLGGTGLSNPMKYFAGLEKLHLSAKPTGNGYILSGTLPAVSNLGKGHWFGVIASMEGKNEIMFFVPCDAERLVLKEKVDYLGVNGSATYSCTFNEVFIPEEWVLSEDAASFSNQIRPAFIAYQIPLGLGVTEASIVSTAKMSRRQNGCNRYLKKQPQDLQGVLSEIKEKIKDLFQSEEVNWKDIACIRLEAVYLALEAVQANMLHHGSAGYIKDSAPSRRLREAYFFANLTPTVKHLEKVLNL